MRASVREYVRAWAGTCAVVVVLVVVVGVVVVVVVVVVVDVVAVVVVLLVLLLFEVLSLLRLTTFCINWCLIRAGEGMGKRQKYLVN